MITLGGGLQIVTAALCRPEDINYGFTAEHCVTNHLRN
jgi:hypothetical protein